MSLEICPGYAEYAEMRPEFLLQIHAPLEKLGFLLRWHRNYHVDWALLHAVVEFWCPKEHVFRFGLDELCPVYEEFSALLKYPARADIFTTIGVSPRDFVKTYLCVKQRLADHFIVKGALDLSRVVQYFLKKRANSGPSIHEGRVAILLLTAEMLLVTGIPCINPSVLEVLQKVLVNNENPALVILGETLNGLDGLHHDRRTFFRGSPWLLYLWLLEHFRLISPISSKRMYLPAYAFSRPLVIPQGQSTEYWITWFAQNGGRSIRWNVPWWELADPVYGLSNTWYVHFGALSSTSFYLVTRIMRQFGWSQDIPKTLSHFREVEPLTPSIISRLTSAWENRRQTRCPNHLQCGVYPLPKETIKWLIYDFFPNLYEQHSGYSWVLGGNFETNNLVASYQALDFARHQIQLLESVWLPPAPLDSIQGIDYYLNEYQPTYARRRDGSGSSGH